jgi:hypothetical protein
MSGQYTVLRNLSYGYGWNLIPKFSETNFIFKSRWISQFSELCTGLATGFPLPAVAGTFLCRDAPRAELQPIQSCTTPMLSWNSRNLMLNTYLYTVPKLKRVVTGIFTQTHSRLCSLIKSIEQSAVTQTWQTQIKSNDFIWVRNFSGKILQQWWQY